MTKSVEAMTLNVAALATAIDFITVNHQRFGLHFYEVKALPAWIMAEAIAAEYARLLREEEAS